MSLKKLTNRWSDKIEGLPEIIEKMRNLKSKQLAVITDGIRDLLNKNDPDFLDNITIECVDMPPKRRWYDQDPYLYIVMNALRFTDKETIREIIRWVDQQII